MKIDKLNQKITERKFMSQMGFPIRFSFKTIKEARDYIRSARHNAANVEKRLGRGAYLDAEGLQQCAIADYIEQLL